jgi:choline dehydrogenase-like flavoprotein
MRLGNFAMYVASGRGSLSSTGNGPSEFRHGVTAMPEYTMQGADYSRQFAGTVFARLDAQDHTHYDLSDFGYVSYEGRGYAIRGGNHLAGTHIVGATKANSVVDKNQRGWDHENLYLVGGGSMPIIGTANVTLTLAAMCFRSSRDILKYLH